MKLSAQAYQIISDALAFYYVESDRFKNENKKQEIMRTIEEFNEMAIEEKK